MKCVLVIGGYGNFGRFICQRLSHNKNIRLVIAGRSREKAAVLAAELGAESFVMDIHHSLHNSLKTVNPDIVIHTSGPFQDQGYDVAQACIDLGAHYIDLADGREFVAGISQLDAHAKAANVAVISGASSVPCLTSALVDFYRTQFETLDSLDYGITTAQKTTRGLATTAAILGYTGKPFKTIIHGIRQDVYGWQGLHARKYKGLGWRLLGYCNVPDLQLFPERYPELKTIRFYAGLELPFVHVVLWGLSWLVRWGLIRHLQSWASLLLRTSFLFDWLGTSNSGFYMTLSGKDKSGQNKYVSFELLARNGDGPYIPCIPAILLAGKLASGEFCECGAMPCAGIISKQEYLGAFDGLEISWIEHWDVN